ncbi:MAG: glycosyltransferase family 4 protein [Actinomycetota bacterium]|nr:glycosyltransferase family 4 protein [Actinomycetota bacterium]
MDVFLDALATVRDSGISFEARILGSGPYEAELRERADGLRISSSVHWQSGIPHDQVPGWMQDLDLFVLPSRTISRWREQFGHVLIEAMATGVPVIGSDSGEIPNVIGRPDLVFQEGDHNALAELMIRLIRDDAWRNEISRYVVHRIHEKFTHAHIARRMITAWEQMLDAPLKR